MKISNSIWYILLLVLSALLGLLLSIYFFSYNSILEYGIHELGRPDLEKTLRQDFFTERKFEGLRRIVPLFIVILSGGIFLWIRNRLKLKKSIASALNYLKIKWGSIFQEITYCTWQTKITLSLLLVVITIRSCYYALHYYAQYDECWNYNYFLSNSLLPSFFAYNNYPLHNVITYMFLQVVPDSTFGMRLPSVLFGLINALLVFVLVKRLFKLDWLALIGLALFAIIPMSVFYMMYARGVMLALFFSLILFYFFIVKGLKNWNRKDIFFASLCVGLGSFSMISFPLYVAGLFLIAFITAFTRWDKTDLKKLTLFLFYTLLFCILLFIPMLLGSGMDLGFQSHYRQATFHFNKYIEQLEMISYIQIGFYNASYVFILLNFLFLAISDTTVKKLTVFNLAMLALPFVVPLVNLTYLPARAYSFQLLSYLFSLIILLYWMHKKVNTSLAVILGSVFVLIGSFISHQHTYLNWSSKQDEEAYHIANLLFENNITNYYNDSPAFTYYVPGISYYYKLHNQEIEYRTSLKKSTRYSDALIKSHAVVISSRDRGSANYKDYSERIYFNKSFMILKRR